MIGAYASAALICAASVAVGHAILLLAGRREFSWLCAPVGLAALVTVSGIAIKLPGHQTAAEVALVLAVLISVAIVWRRAPTRLEGGIAPGLAAGAIALLLASIPFIASGRVGILGVGLVNDDMAYHLLMADWIGSHSGFMPALIHQGYPVGPHALVDAVSGLLGTSLVNGFAGLTLALPVLMALTAAGALKKARPAARVAVGALVALSYLGAAYLAQEAFKEPMEALFLLAFALALPQARTVRSAIPLGVIGAGAVYAYSFPGLFWLIGAAALYLASSRWVTSWFAQTQDPTRPGGGGPPLLPLLAAGGIVAVFALPELGRLIDFTHFKAFSPATANSGGLGNLRHHLSPLEALGVWPTSEFRLAAGDSAHPIAYFAGAALALAAFVAGAPRWIRRYGPAVPAALASAALIYVVARVSGTVYTSAKALSIASPLLLLVGLGGLVSAEGERRSWPLRALAAAFGLAALASSFLVLRQAPVGPTTHHDELATFRPTIEGKKVLFLGRDDFVLYDLLGSKPYVTVHNYYDNYYAKPNLKLKNVFEKFDFDTVTPQTLAKFPYVITTRGAYASGPPPWLRPVETTRDFVLWKRESSGVSLDRRVLDEGDAPGAILRCASHASAPGSRATIFLQSPVTSSDWTGGSTVENGSPTTTTVNLPRGRWNVSLQYDATRPVHLTGPGLDSTIPANLDYRGTTPYYAAGIIDAGGGPVTVTVSVEQPPLAGRLLGATSQAHLGAVAFTPTALGGRSGIMPAPGAADVPVPATALACRRYVDWYSVTSR